VNRQDFHELSELRLAEAKALLDSGHYDGAYYLAGYAIECALKACIAKQTRQFDFPPDRQFLQDVYTHDLDRLVHGAGLDRALRMEVARNTQFGLAWITVKDWKETSRYERKTQRQAENLYNAISNPVNGVLIWLQRIW
jgi:HEPN domain-containing protein